MSSAAALDPAAERVSLSECSGLRTRSCRSKDARPENRAYRTVFFSLSTPTSIMPSVV